MKVAFSFVIPEVKMYEINMMKMRKAKEQEKGNCAYTPLKKIQTEFR